MTLEGNKKKVGDAAEASSRPLASKTGDPKSLKRRLKSVKKSGNPKSLKPKHKIVKKTSDQNSSRTKDSTAAQIEGEPNHEKNKTDKSIKETDAINQKKDDKKKNLQEMNKGKSIIDENSMGDQKDKEELGGLIFMCNGRTKPDCFRYGIMGVPLNQKELVMEIKPGLKLFLYDFDLKLMYGIYKASSAGGMKLEPAAFGGAFPVQVRFQVHKDCFPLPENEFKRAIEDNYDQKTRKFKTKLTVLQVKKLTRLFQTSPHVQSNAQIIQAPAQPQFLAPPMPMFQTLPHVQSNAQIIQAPSQPQLAPPMPMFQSSPHVHSNAQIFQAPSQPQLRAPPMPTLPAGKVSEGSGEPLHHATRVTVLSDPYFLDGGRRQFLPSDNGSQQLSREPVLTHIEVTTQKEAAVHLNPRFMTEKEYRTYGLSREQHTLSPSASMDRNASVVDPYQKDHAREQLPRHVGPQHRETASRETDQVHRDPLFLSEKDYRAYGLGKKSPSLVPQASVANSVSRLDTYAKDPYYPHHYGSTSSDAFPSVPRGETTSLEPYALVPRRETYLTKSQYQERDYNDFSRSVTDEVGGLYSRHASNVLSDYNEKHHHLGGRHELASTSVSSRYSFDGPSLTYR